MQLMNGLKRWLALDTSNTVALYNTKHNGDEDFIIPFSFRKFCSGFFFYCIGYCLSNMMMFACIIIKHTGPAAHEKSDTWSTKQMSQKKIVYPFDRCVNIIIIIHFIISIIIAIVILYINIIIIWYKVKLGWDFVYRTAIVNSNMTLSI